MKRSLRLAGGIATAVALAALAFPPALAQADPTPAPAPVPTSAPLASPVPTAPASPQPGPAPTETPQPAPTPTTPAVPTAAKGPTCDVSLWNAASWNPLNLIQCSAANFAAGWWAGIGNAVVALSELRVDNPQFVIFYQACEFLALFWIVGRWLWIIGTSGRRQGVSLSDYTFGSALRAGAAVVCIQLLPGLMALIESNLIHPAVQALIGAQADQVGIASSRFALLLLTVNPMGGQLTVIIYGLITGLAAMLLLVMLIVRNVLLLLMASVLCFAVAEIIPGQAYERIKRHLHLLLALFFMPIVLSAILWLGVGMMNGTDPNSVIGSLMMMATGMATLGLCVFALPLLASLFGGIGEHLTLPLAAAATMRGKLGNLAPISPRGVAQMSASNAVTNRVGSVMANRRNGGGGGGAGSGPRGKGGGGSGPRPGGPAGSGPGAAAGAKGGAVAAGAKAGAAGGPVGMGVGVVAGAAVGAAKRAGSAAASGAAGAARAAAPPAYTAGARGGGGGGSGGRPNYTPQPTNRQPNPSRAPRNPGRRT